MNKKIQQEMVGFVLIVVIVIVAGLVLFLINVKKESAETPSEDLYNFVLSSLAYTTDCAPVIIPQYSSLSELIKNCYRKEDCKNLNRESCDYLNETINSILQDFVKTRSDVQGYYLTISYNSSYGQREILPAFGYGNCTSARIFNTEEKIRVDDLDLDIRLKVCRTE